MATIRSVLGDIEGSAGQITFSKLNGKNILRQKVGSNGSNTPAQQAIRARFALLGQLYKSLTALVKLGLPRQNGQSPYNRFVRLNFPATSYDPLAAAAAADLSLLVASQTTGVVEQLDNLNAESVGSQVTARWSPDFGAVTDQVTVSVLDGRTNRSWTSAPVPRSAGSVAVVTGLPDADMATYGTLLAVAAAPGTADRSMTGNVSITAASI